MSKHDTYMNEVWSSWGWLFHDKVSQLDHLTRRIIKDFGNGCVPPEKWQPFLAEQLQQSIERCAREAEEAAKQERKRPSRGVSSLSALKKRRAKNGNLA